MASGANTAEYRTLVARTDDLELALRSGLISIGGALFSNELISHDNYSSVRNNMHSESLRAANLVSLIQGKVLESAQNYHKFIKVLEENQTQYSVILSKLKETYTQKKLQQGTNVPPAPVAYPTPQSNPVSSETQSSSSVITFSPNLSDDEFMRYLKNGGLSDEDCEVLKKNRIGAKIFATDFGEDDVNSDELGFSYGGKKVLKRLLRDMPSSIGADGQATGPIEFNENDRKQISIDGGGKKIPVDYFEPYRVDRSKRRQIKFDFGTVVPKKGKKVSTIEEYDMSKFPHGMALIINNESFEGKERRHGTAIDERHLTHAFRYLGYIVEVHREVDSQQMLAIMMEMGRRNHNDFDSFVCCILSHGTAGYVFGTDGQLVSLARLTQAIDAQRCSSLCNKPKLFFLQACRGHLTENSVNVGADGEIRTIPQEIPEKADFLFGYATPLGHVAWRDFDHGSWYVSELCRTFCEMNTYASLNDMMTEVCSRVASGEKYKWTGYRMTPEMSTHLQGNVYF